MGTNETIESKIGELATSMTENYEYAQPNTSVCSNFFKQLMLQSEKNMYTSFIHLFVYSFKFYLLLPMCKC